MEPTSSPQSGRSARRAARLGAEAIQHSRFLGAQGPRPLAMYRKADHSLRRATPCSQSQIGQDRYLGSWGAAQLTAVVVLSVAVRWEPTLTLVNGTLVARPVRLTWLHGGVVGSQFDRRVSVVLGDHCIVGKPRTRRGSVFWSVRSRTLLALRPPGPRTRQTSGRARAWCVLTPRGNSAVRRL
jgi:hypothetical protein